MNNVVAGLGISNKFAQALPYAPAYIGLVASIVELLVVPRSEGHVRFHASQGMALHLAIIAIGILFSIIGAISGNHAGGSLFWLASTIFLVVSMIRAYKGEGYQITPLEDAARFINQHLAPKR